MVFQLLTVSDSIFLSLFLTVFSLFKFCYYFLTFFRFWFAFGFCLVQFVLFYWMANGNQASVRKEWRQKRMASFQFIVFTIHNIIFSIRSLPLFRDDEFAFRFCVQNIYSCILFHFDYGGRVVMGRWIDGVGCCSCCYLFFSDIHLNRKYSLNIVFAVRNFLYLFKQFSFHLSITLQSYTHAHSTFELYFPIR